MRETKRYRDMASTYCIIFAMFIVQYSTNTCNIIIRLKYFDKRFLIAFIVTLVYTVRHCVQRERVC